MMEQINCPNKSRQIIRNFLRAGAKVWRSPNGITQISWCRPYYVDLWLIGRRRH
jgi:hypothetical protein